MLLPSAAANAAVHQLAPHPHCRRDAYVYEGTSFDSCGGHASPQSQYHYHTDQLKSGCAYVQTAGQHSPMLGVMIDSIPIYGSLGERWSGEERRGAGQLQQRTHRSTTTSRAAAPVIDACVCCSASPAGDGGKAPTDLDECGGHSDSAYPFYHYHATGTTFPYTGAWGSAEEK